MAESEKIKGRVNYQCEVELCGSSLSDEFN